MIRDKSLAPQGQKKIDWVKGRMPVLSHLEKEFARSRPFDGLRMAVCLHLEAKTAYLVQVLQAGGAVISAAASNPLSTQDDVVAAMAEWGIKVFAWYGATEEEYNLHINRALDLQPELVIDDGADLISLLHTTRQPLAARVIGGCEETTTGVTRLRAMEKEGKLLFPMVAVNDAFSKQLFDNRYGTGQSVWDGILRTTNLLVAGKTVVVIGYGWCGKGVALRAAGLGARVIVCEVDPIRANEAVMDGYRVMRLIDAAPVGDFFITVTGNRGVIRKEHFQAMQDRAILANAGHFDVEISKPDLEELAVTRREARQNIEEYSFKNGKKLFLLAQGRLVNLAAGDGHPAEIMDMSFALQALAAKYLLESRGTLPAMVQRVPEELDREVSRMRLAALGVTMDTLTTGQQAYLESWS
ncbi:MAG: adenosylhomocysteinase [Bacillota bacterium]